MSSIACQNLQVIGQNDINSKIIEPNHEVNKNTENQMFKKTRDKPEIRTVELPEKLDKGNLEKLNTLDRDKLGEILGWTGFCSSNNISLRNLEKDTYVIEVVCNQERAYQGGFLFCYIDESALTSKLTSFEYFSKDDIRKPIERHISYYMIGESRFDEEEKTLYFRDRYFGGGNCGLVRKI